VLSRVDHCGTVRMVLFLSEWNNGTVDVAVDKHTGDFQFAVLVDGACNIRASRVMVVVLHQETPVLALAGLNAGVDVTINPVGRCRCALECRYVERTGVMIPGSALTDGSQKTGAAVGKVFS